MLKGLYEGYDRTKNIQILNLKRDFEAVPMKENNII